MKPLHSLCLSALLCLGGAATAQTLTQNGRTAYAIVIPDQPPVTIRTAAAELADHLQQITGVTFPVLPASKRNAAQPALIIGSESSDKLQPDEISIVTRGNDILFDGQLPRGPLYAVYTFLEDTLGVRWWTATESTIPHIPNLTVPPQNHRFVPPVLSRETFYKECYDKVFGARLKHNGHFSKVDTDHGGHYSIIGWCHTFFQFLPPNKYFAQHPEWYSLIKGKRDANNSQLCLTNEEMRKEFVRVCLEKIRREPWAGMIDISQNDWDGRCQCPKCQAVEAEEGAFSGLLLRFVNACAADIEKEYPNFLIETLAYQYGRTPPKITRPRHNVVIRLCVGGVNHAQNLVDGPDNAAFREQTAAWSAIAPKLFIWNYLANFHSYILPHPNYRDWDTDLRFFVKHHAISIFEQGDAQSNVGDFCRARAWVIAHLLWNPELKQQDLMQEFFQGYYGPAAPHLLAYLDFLCDTYNATGQSLQSSREVSSWLPVPAILKAREIYARAENAVRDNTVFADRVRRERLPLDHALLLSQVSLARRQRFLGEKTDVDSKLLRTVANEFVDLTERWKAGALREGNAFGGYALKLRSDLFPEFIEVPEECKNLTTADWDCFDVRNFRTFEGGRESFRAIDPDSRTGTSVWMPGNHAKWLVQCDIHDDFDKSRPWKALLRVRIDADAKDGTGLLFGIYDNQAKKCVINYPIPISAFDGNRYTVIETPAFTLGNNMYIWFAPPNRPLSEVKRVTMDRVILIRTPKQP